MEIEVNNFDPGQREPVRAICELFVKLGAANDLSGGHSALAERDTKALISKTYPRANTRALFCVALAVSSAGLGVAVAYTAGISSAAGLTQFRARQMLSAQAQGFSDRALEQAQGLSPGALAIAQRHDPFTVSGAAQRDRQSAEFAARLDPTLETSAGSTAVSLMLRPDLGPDGDSVAHRLRFASIGALDGARDLDCLTQAVYYEARGESPKGQAAVAQVVLNRVRHPAFPKTICAVVFQGAGAAKSDCQFSFVCDGSMRAPRDDEAWDKAQHVAARALSGVVVAEVGGATHFHTSRPNDQWGESLVRVAQVGLHVFYRFGHPRPPFQAQLLQAAADVVTPRVAVEAKTPVLASLLPPGPAPAPTEPAKPEAAKEAQGADAEAPKPVAEKKADVPKA
jgi:spore germination cell wall hydrolase CwlJ-like protein